MDNFDRASARTHRHARRLLDTGIPAIVAADALLTSALALWAADTARHADAQALTAIWCAVRDDTHGS